MHARSKNTFISYAFIFTFLAQLLPNESFNEKKCPNPSLCVTLICGDWSDGSHFHFIVPVTPDKAAHPLLLCVQRLQRMDLHFHSDQREKTNMWAGNMLMFPAGVNMKRLKIRFNNDTFQWFRVKTFFWETITLNTVRFKIKNSAGCFHSFRELCYTLHERSFSKKRNRGTLNRPISLWNSQKVLEKRCVVEGMEIVLIQWLEIS